MSSQFLKSRLITKHHDDDKDLKEYIEKASKILGIDYPMEYLKQGVIRVFKDGEGIIRGGYTLVLKPPFRTLNSLPDNEISEKILEDLKQYDLFEINGLWLDRNIKSGIPSCQFWYRVSRDIASQDKDYLLYSFELAKKRLAKMYDLSKPIVLYRGMVKQLPGMDDIAYESIQMCSPKRILYLPIYAFPNFMSKFLFKRKTYGFNAFKLKFNKAPAIGTETN